MKWAGHDSMGEKNAHNPQRKQHLKVFAENPNHNDEHFP